MIRLCLLGLHSVCEAGSGGFEVEAVASHHPHHLLALCVMCVGVWEMGGGWVGGWVVGGVDGWVGR